MKKKSIFGFVILFFLISLIVGTFSFKNVNVKKDTDYISSVLKKPAYSYLPVEAKNYIREVYEETGEVLLTEKNKKEGIAYLNPQYVSYLELSDELKAEYDYIPSDVISDYVSGTYEGSSDFSSSFDLRNVNGKNYVTPVESQGNAGLCWAYSANSQVESLILSSNDTSYSTDFKLFSERQLDYATSGNGIVDNKSLYEPYYSSFSRKLYDDGGVYTTAWDIYVDSLSLVDISWQQGKEKSKNVVEPSEVFKFKNSLYEVDNTVYLSTLNIKDLDLTNEDDLAKKDEYINSIKNLIKNYGGAVVGTIDPLANCTLDVGDTQLIEFDNDVCKNTAGHAMQIIGWDDDYEYEYCKLSNAVVENYYDCSNGTIVKGKGVWILKNSWGSSNQYPLLAYDSDDSYFSAVVKVDNKSWDNFYHSTRQGVMSVITNDFDNTEKIEKIKLFVSPYQLKNENMDVYVKIDSGENVLIDTIKTDYAGYYTIDLSSKNYNFNRDVEIAVKYGSKYLLFDNGTVRVYTSNIDDKEYIETDDYTYNGGYTNDNNFTFRLNQTTRGIEEDSLIDYRILDSNNNEITSNYVYTNNTVYANNIYPKIVVENGLENGEYTIETIYSGNVLCSSKLIINAGSTLISGDGTKENPYVITNSSQLNLIRNNTNKYYVLGNDIDLTYDTQNENGKFYNNGLGWDPIEYNDSSSDEKLSIYLDGKGYKIKGLYINRPSEDYVGLFKNLYSYYDGGSNSVYITNLIIEDANITGNNYVGALAGRVDSRSNIYTVYLQNIYTLGGSITGNNYVAGIIGILRAGVYSEYYYDRISSLFNSASIVANDYAGGLFGYVENTHSALYMDVAIKNVINIGNVTANNGNASGIIGSLKLKNKNITYLENILNIGTVKGKNCSSGITCSLAEDSNGTYTLKNAYYIDNTGYDKSNTSTTATNVKQINVNNLGKNSLYSSWDSFSSYWVLQTVDNINRVPRLKNMSFDYINSTDYAIDLGMSKSIELDDVISSSYDLKYDVLDSDIVSIKDGVITRNKEGITYLVVSSKYEKLFIPIVDGLKYTVSFDSNGGTGTIDDIQLSYGDVITIPSNMFKREGYVFVEWNTKADGTGISYKGSEQISPVANIKLYAIWKPISYNVYWYNEDQTKFETGTNKYDVEYIAFEYKWTLKDGYKFKEWNTEYDGTGKSLKLDEKFKNLTNVNNSTIKFYAIILPINYKISFNANGGTGTMNNEDLTYDLALNLTKNTFTREGYTFKEWNTKADGTGTSYKDEESVINLAKSENDIVKLYAQWQEDFSYKINDYKNDEENKYISSINVGTTLDEFVSHIKLNSNYTVKVDTKEIDGKKIIYTGGKTKIYKDNELYVEYTNIVIGDVNGNAIIDIIDYIRIMKDIMETQKLSGPYLKAADVNQNGSIDIIDYIRIMKMIMEEN